MNFNCCEVDGSNGKELIEMMMMTMIRWSFGMCKLVLNVP